MPIRKAYVDCSAGQIHYRYVEGSGTPIVFFQQTASSSKMYIKTMTALAGEYPLYAFDTPGFGESFDPATQPTMGDYADWLLQAIDALGLTRFHIFGHHTGACLAVELGVRHAARVASLMMVGPVPLTAAERLEFSRRFGAPIAPNAEGEYLTATWDYLRELGAHADLALHHRELIDTTRAYRGRALAYAAVWDQDWTALYQQVQCPMLLLCAPDDVLFPFFARAQEIRPDARAVTLSGANFEPDLDSAGTVAAIRGFLQTC
ncbi:MAG: alpha/beta fold hydrolase [Gammaproteobacteria bacterium]|nr:alpha/beta fold hydrolase [Gammaproteobacteria bacterium]